MSAYNDLIKYLDKGETVEAIVFGNWGWDGYGEPRAHNVPKAKRFIILTLDEAAPLMQKWSFYSGYGAPDCYATYIWTNQRIIWVTQYDGSTTLDSAPRNPEVCTPYIPGG